MNRTLINISLVDEAIATTSSYWFRTMSIITLIFSPTGAILNIFPLAAFNFQNPLFSTANLRVFTGCFALFASIFDTCMFFVNVRVVFLVRKFVVVDEVVCTLLQLPGTVAYILITFLLMSIAIERFYASIKNMDGDLGDGRKISIAIVAYFLVSTVAEQIFVLKSSDKSKMMVCLGYRVFSAKLSTISMVVLLILCALSIVLLFLSKKIYARRLASFNWASARGADLRTK